MAETKNTGFRKLCSLFSQKPDVKDTAIQLSISADAIYQDSICRLKALSDSQFKLFANGKTVACTKGMQADNGAISTEDKGKHYVELSLIGLITGRSTGIGGTHEASKYGMRYFPFISSHFLLEINISSKLQDIMLEIPANFRLIWNSASATAPYGEEAKLSTSYAEKVSTYIFSWHSIQPNGTYILKFDVRTGGPGLLKAAYFPIYYYVIALAAVAAAATAEHVNILVAAVAGSWVFLLRHLNMCDIPQRNVFLFYASLLLGSFLLLWGVTWKLNRYYFNELYIVIETVIAISMIWISLRAVNNFVSKGTLPHWINRLWGGIININIQQQSK